MHSTLIIVESMSATSSRLRRPARDCTTTSTPGSSPSSTARAGPPSLPSRRSQARSGSTHSSPAVPPRASSAAEISPRASRSFAINVAMNSDSTGKPPLVLIAGPTASGKSALASTLAEQVGGVVINADSAQVYRDLRLVSARPAPDEEGRAPHRLYGYRDGEDTCSAADWAADAKAEIHAAHRAGRLPILCGGTGLYIRTLIEGIAPVPEIDPGVRTAIRGLTADEAHSALVSEDREAARRLKPGDTTRTRRALEVVRSTGRTLKTWQAEKAGGIGAEVTLRPLILLPPRAWLHERCDQRFEKIFSDEGIEEVGLLLERRLPTLAPVMRAIGVPGPANMPSANIPGSAASPLPNGRALRRRSIAILCRRRWRCSAPEGTTRCGSIMTAIATSLWSAPAGSR